MLTVDAGAALQIPVVLNPATGGEQFSTFTFMHNGTESPYILNAGGLVRAGSIVLAIDHLNSTVTNIPFYFRFMQPQTVTATLWAHQRGSWLAPVAADQRIRIKYGTTNYVGQLGVATESRPPLAYTMAMDPIAGDVDIRTDGTFTYSPDPDYVGRDDFLFRVANPDGISTGHVNIVIQRTSLPWLMQLLD